MKFYLSLLILILLTAGCEGIVSWQSSSNNVDIERGEYLFFHGTESAPACTVCHASAAGERRLHTVAPNLVGIATRATTRSDDALAYLHESIVSPGTYIVEGFANGMFQDYEHQLSEQDITDLIAFLLTL